MLLYTRISRLQAVVVETVKNRRKIKPIEIAYMLFLLHLFGQNRPGYILLQ
jgi:hypothetical protein